MPRNGHNNGLPASGPPCRIDSRDLTAQELGDALDFLLASQEIAPEGEQFPRLVRLLDGVAKVNPHQHITGSVGGGKLLQRAIQIYQQDQAARRAFLDYAVSQRMLEEDKAGRFFLRSQDELLNWFETHVPLPGDPQDFKEADDRLNLVRLAFQSKTPESLGLLKEAYRTVALENAAHGVVEVWFRTFLGDHQRDFIGDAAVAALEGASEVNADSSIPICVRFLVGLRKYFPCGTPQVGTAALADTRAEGLVRAITALRRQRPEAQTMVRGIDSVGMDSCWRPDWQAAARRTAAADRLHVAVHFGESWQEGRLLAKLGMLSDLVSHGVVHQLDNANALFAVKDLASFHQKYSNDEWVEIRKLQLEIFQAMADRGIALGINPTSNDLLTRSLREREGWRFRAMAEPFGVGRLSVADLVIGSDAGDRPLLVVVGNDNSRLYPSRIGGAFLTVSEELANLWDAPGSINFSVYGKLSTRIVAQLIHNGFILALIANGGWFNSPQHTGITSPEPAQMEVARVLQPPYSVDWRPGEATGVPGDSTPISGPTDYTDFQSGELEP